VIAAGVTLTGMSTIYDTVRETVVRGTSDAPAVVPAGAYTLAVEVRVDDGGPPRTITAAATIELR